MSDFVYFARSHGLLIDHAFPDGRWHRVPTETKPKKRNGAYVFDGQKGAVIDFGTMSEHATWRSNGEVRHRPVVVRSVVDERKRHAEASRLAADMIKRAAVSSHAYLERKGFPKETGFVLDGELLIPMRGHADRQLYSLQQISAEGEKKFLSGGRAKGCVYGLGPNAKETWLVEGYATGLSVQAALKDLYRDSRVLVCFSAGNLAHVGAMCKPPSYVIADNDSSKAGEEAAKKTNLPWVMPPEVDTDANDLHQRHGLRALANLLREITVRARAALRRS